MSNCTCEDCVERAAKYTDERALAVTAERKRCEQWAQAMRSGQIDDVRSLIQAIRSGEDYSTEEAE